MKQTIDTLFTNGRIYSLESEGAFYEALGVDGGIIVYTGSAAEAEDRFAPQKRIDLQGRTMLPGMGDSHVHFYATCQALTTVDLLGCKTKAEAVERLRKRAEETPEGTWIKGSNFDQSKWTDTDDQLPTRQDLDLASTRHPIVIKRICLHAAVGNTLAVHTAGIPKGYVFGTGGLVELEEDGTPNGVFREQASKLFDDVIPDPLLDPDNRRILMKKVFDQISSYGVTMMHTYAAKIWNFAESTQIYEELDEEGLLPARMSICLDEPFEPQTLTEAERKDPFRKVQYGSFKIFVDGSLGARSAALFEPYTDAPDTKGLFVIEQSDLNEKTYRAYQKGLQPAIHCIGDAGTDAVLQAIEYTLNRCRAEGTIQTELNQNPPFRLIHAQLLNEDVINRMKGLPLIFDLQPVSMCTDMHWMEQRVGKERAKYAHRIATLRDMGFILTGSSDAPVESISPWPGIYAAATRQDLDGRPEGGWNPEEKISLYEAVCMFSKNIPYAICQEDLTGTLTCGKFADMIVIDRDVFERPVEDVLHVKVLKTYLAGQEVYSV
ncbi:MAG: amidohydrolase [Eubacteriales bacterium]|nr:amidohydrolase [Eubacteriales bacterium]MDD3537097.1 amidohydrolase [Eubacteriales bacterium]